ncbi:MAG: glycosyltransferase family 2 protein [Lachnospiraceae bacterium]|nr:glycosyltransferase family 2 protein [Lachnospiraceae bacterium]
MIEVTKKQPILYMIIPCFNEQDVLPVTIPLFLEKIQYLIKNDLISQKSRILFVDDGSDDRTWEIIKDFAEETPYCLGISQSSNKGHQNAILAGLMEVKDYCDITISMDCDGQDDISKVDEMIEQYKKGYEIVYGVRCDRKTDSFFKRFSAKSYYKLLNKIGVDTIPDHADFRLVSARVLQELSNFHEVNLFLRGLFQIIGFSSTKVYYERKERIKGKTHYSLSKMIFLAFDGITGFSVWPIRFIIKLGFAVTLLSIVAIMWAIIMSITGHTVSGWTSLMCVICFFGGINMTALGVIGEYIGKTFLEAKHRPRYIIKERTYEGINTDK